MRSPRPNRSRRLDSIPAMDRAAKILLALLVGFVLWLGYQDGENADRARIERLERQVRQLQTDVSLLLE